jgi:hypothetical protein
MDRQEQAGGQGEELVTKVARRVLADCRTALQMLDEEERGDHWRVTWAGAVAMIRTVGDVLDKVDGTDPRIKAVAAQQFQFWKSEFDPDKPKRRDLFWAFIKTERDQLLHEYRSDVYPADRATSAVQNLHTGESLPFEIDGNLFKQMQNGPWAGEDARDVYLEAVEWWEKQLDAIDRQCTS